MLLNAATATTTITGRVDSEPQPYRFTAVIFSGLAMMPPSPFDELAAASPLFVSALARGMSVLAAFNGERTSLSLLEIATSTGLTKSAVQRFTHTLWQTGYLRKCLQTGKYALSPRSLTLGTAYLQTSQLTLGGTSFLHSLNRGCKETCTLSEPDGVDMIYVARFASHQEMFVNMAIGTILPMYCSAGGRAVMACMDPQEVDDILHRSTLKAYTPNTLDTVEKVVSEIEFARRNGFARSNGEIYAGDINVSAAIQDSNLAPVGAVTVSVPSSRWTYEQAQTILAPQVIETAKAIEASRYKRS